MFWVLPIASYPSVLISFTQNGTVARILALSRQARLPFRLLPHRRPDISHSPPLCCQGLVLCSLLVNHSQILRRFAVRLLTQFWSEDLELLYIPKSHSASNRYLFSLKMWLSRVFEIRRQLAMGNRLVSTCQASCTLSALDGFRRHPSVRRTRVT